MPYQKKVPYQKKYLIKIPYQESKKDALIKEPDQGSKKCLIKLVWEFIKKILKQFFKDIMQKFKKLTKKTPELKYSYF